MHQQDALEQEGTQLRVRERLGCGQHRRKAAAEECQGLFACVERKALGLEQHGLDALRQERLVVVLLHNVVVDVTVRHGQERLCINAPLPGSAMTRALALARG